MRDLAWSGDGRDLKMIFIAGNEPFTQGGVDFRSSCREAIGRGIVVNTIFCGAYQEGLRTDWKAGADLADGQYLAIDADNAPPPVAAPQDPEIARLSRELNRTYVAYGKDGGAGKRRQEAQDKNAATVSGEVLAQRAAAKAAPQYSNPSWDLVDAKKSGQVKLEELSESELPQEMKGMSARERDEYVAAMQGRRDQLQKKIAALNGEREKFVREKTKGSAAAGTLDEAILRALRRQATRKISLSTNNGSRPWKRKCSDRTSWLSALLVLSVILAGRAPLARRRLHRHSPRPGRCRGRPRPFRWRW